MDKREKNQLLKSLKRLTKIFSDDQDSLESLDLLHSKLEKIEITENPVSDEDYPLPANLKNKKDTFAVFSDGGCRGNPGPGAWGVMVQASDEKVLFEASGFDEETTNNKMELMGAIQGLSLLRDHLKDEKVDLGKANVSLFTDSQYVVKGINEWIAGWKRRGWKKADKKEPENLELWKVLDSEVNLFPNINLQWVKGHAGHPQNERCDQLANQVLDNEGY